MEDGDALFAFLRGCCCARVVAWLRRLPIFALYCRTLLALGRLLLFVSHVLLLMLRRHDAEAMQYTIRCWLEDELFCSYSLRTLMCTLPTLPLGSVQHAAHTWIRHYALVSCRHIDFT